jgi:hypothetical protein
MAYRQYFDPSAFPRATAVYWHRQGDSTVVYADYHRAVDRDILRFPDYLVGKNITVIEKTPSVECPSGVRVPSQGLVVSVTGEGGFFVLKLDEP